MDEEGVIVIVFVHVALGGTIRPPKAKVPPLPYEMLVIVQGLPTVVWKLVITPPVSIGIVRAPPVTAVLLVLVIVIVNVVDVLAVTVVELSGCYFTCCRSCWR